MLVVPENAPASPPSTASNKIQPATIRTRRRELNPASLNSKVVTGLLTPGSPAAEATANPICTV